MSVPEACQSSQAEDDVVVVSEVVKSSPPPVKSPAQGIRTSFLSKLLFICPSVQFQNAANENSQIYEFIKFQQANLSSSLLKNKTS